MPSGQIVEVGVREFRNRLADFLEMAHRGTTVVVASRGHVLARLVPPEPANLMPFGALARQIRMAPDFDETPPDLIDAMEKAPL